MTSNDIKIGVQPIAWSNDDFLDLGANISLEDCLDDMRNAGYEGTELGHKFPKDPGKLKEILKSYDLQLVSGWHSTYFLENDFDRETERFDYHLNFLNEMGSEVIIVADCSGRTYNDPAISLRKEFGSEINEADMKKITNGLNFFSGRASTVGMKLVYHHHMGTVIQNQEEIDRLMEDTTYTVQLLLDTGHAEFAGIDPIRLAEDYKDRIGHVHLKNTRNNILEKVWGERWSFDRAVREGVFTVPGDKEGSIDYEPIFKTLVDAKYKGWFVVEAEQDPSKANPLEYAKIGRQFIKDNISM